MYAKEQLYFDTTKNTAFEYNGTTWVELGLSAELREKLTNIEAGADKIKYATMPTASADNAGLVVIYTGETDGTYTAGHTYRCVATDGTFGWVDISPTIKGGETDGATVTVEDGTVKAEIKISTDANNALQIKTLEDGTTGLFVEADEVGAATTEEDGLMTKEQVAKLEGIAEGAQVNVLEGVQVNGTDLTIDENKKVNIVMPEATTDKAGLMSAADKAKLDGVAEGAQANVIEAVKVDGVALEITDKAVNIDLSKKANLVDGKIPASELPSFVDDVIELVAVAETAPETCVAGDKYFNTTANKIYTATADNTWGAAEDPEAGKIYVNLADNRTYRWSGSTLVEISSSVVIGTTAGTAYDGAAGQANAEAIAKNAEDIAKNAEDIAKIVNGEIVADKANKDGEGNVITDTYLKKNEAITTGTHTKITYDENGLVVKGEDLTIDDIPDLSEKYINVDQKGVANGVATLDENGLIPVEQVPGGIGIQKYSENIGDGAATEFTITHNLGTQDVTITLRDAASPFEVVYADIAVETENTIKVSFGAAPAAGQYRVTVIG